MVWTVTRLSILEEGQWECIMVDGEVMGGL